MKRLGDRKIAKEKFYDTKGLYKFGMLMLIYSYLKIS